MNEKFLFWNGSNGTYSDCKQKTFTLILYLSPSKQCTFSLSSVFFKHLQILLCQCAFIDQRSLPNSYSPMRIKVFYIKWKPIVAMDDIKPQTLIISLWSKRFKQLQWNTKSNIKQLTQKSLHKSSFNPIWKTLSDTFNISLFS